MMFGTLSIDGPRVGPWKVSKYVCVFCVPE